MKNISVVPFIDSYHPQKDGKCKVSIRITSQRIKRYYPTDLSLAKEEFCRIYPNNFKTIFKELTPEKIDGIRKKRLTDDEKKAYRKILSFEKKATDIIESLPVFSFGLFEERYLTNRQATDTVSFGFDEKIKELKEAD